MGFCYPDPSDIDGLKRSNLTPLFWRSEHIAGWLTTGGAVVTLVHPRDAEQCPAASGVAFDEGWKERGFQLGLCFLFGRSLLSSHAVGVFAGLTAASMGAAGGARPG